MLRYRSRCALAGYLTGGTSALGRDREFSEKNDFFVAIEVGVDKPEIKEFAEETNGLSG